MNVSDDGKIQALRAKLIFVGSATTLIKNYLLLHHFFPLSSCN